MFIDDGWFRRQQIFINSFYAHMLERIVGIAIYKKFKGFKVGVLSTGFALVGYYINGNILSKYFSFDNYNNVYFINIKEEDLGEGLIKITSGVLNDIFGYCNNARIFSLQGINNGCVIICVFLILIMSAKVYKKNCTLFVKFYNISNNGKWSCAAVS